MKKSILATLCVATATIATPSVWAVGVTTYDASITAIFGGGNVNGGWTESTAANYQAAFRGKNRLTSATPQPNTLGVYEFSAADVANVNFEFSFNSDVGGLMGRDISDPPFVNYQISVDTDGSLGVSFNTYSVLLYPDNSLGNNSTANGAGVETGQYNLYNIMQNSERMSFFPNLITTPGTYDILVSILNGNDVVTSAGGQIQIGERATSVPDTGGTLALFSLSFVGLCWVSRKKRSLSVS